MSILKVCKILIFILFFCFTSDIFAQTRTTTLKLLSPGYIVSHLGDTIFNPTSGVWSFGGDTIKNVVIQGLEAMSNADKTYWVSKGFPNTGKYYNSIQAALNNMPSPANINESQTLIVLPGKYQAFINDKPYTSIIGIGNPIIDSMIVEFQIQNVANNVTIENFTIVDDYLEANPYSGANFYTITSTGNIILRNIKILYNDTLDFTTNTMTPTYNGIFFDGQISGPSVIDNCYIEAFIKHNPSSPDNINPYTLTMNLVNGLKYTGYENSLTILNTRLRGVTKPYKNSDSIITSGIKYNQSVFSSNDNEFYRFKVKNSEIELTGTLRSSMKYYSLNGDSPAIIQDLYTNWTHNLTSPYIFLSNFFSYPIFKITY